MNAQKTLLKLASPIVAVIAVIAICFSVTIVGCNNGDQKATETTTVKTDSTTVHKTDTTTAPLNENAKDTGRGVVNPPPPK